MISNKTNPLPFFFIRIKRCYVRILFSEIVYVEGCQHYCRIYTEKKCFIIQITMQKMEEALEQYNFCRVHRSYILSISKITAFKSDVVFLDEKQIPISEQYSKVLQNKVKILVNDIRVKRKPRPQQVMV